MFGGSYCRHVHDGQMKKGLVGFEERKQGPRVSGRDRGGKGRPLQAMELVAQEELGPEGAEIL